MAVEIPVIVDIEGAFKDAAGKVASAMKPLQREVSENALDLTIGKVSIDDDEIEVTLRKIKSEGADTFGGLEHWIEVTKNKLVELANAGDKAEFTKFLEVKHYLEDMQTSAEKSRLSIDGLANSLKGIRANLAAANTALENDPIGSDSWKQAAKDAAMYEQQLQDIQQQIKALTKQDAAVDFSEYISKAEEALASASMHARELRIAMKGMMSEKEIALFEPDVSKYHQMVTALQQAQEALNKASDFSGYIEGLSTVNIELLQMKQYYADLEASSRKMSTSIEGYRERVAEINEQWRQLTYEQKYDSSGKMTAQAEKLYNSFVEETKEMEKQAKELSEIYNIEKRRNELRAKGAQNRRYEDAILNSTIKTMRVLQEQERILSDRLSRAQIGTPAYKELEVQLASVHRQMKGVTGEATKQTGVFAKLASTFGAYISIHSLMRFAKGVRDVTGELEYQRVALGHLLQDVSYGNYLFERVKAAAIESPFRIKDLVTYTKQLAAYRIEQESLFDTTKRLADISAGLGVDMNRLILAYGQVRAASVLRGQELRQFTEAGIPLVELLADKFSELNGRAYKTAEVFELISQRAVPFSMISEIFEDLTDKGGMFYKMQEEQAKTLKGRWEKLKDAYDIALQEVGDTKAFQGINDVILNILNTGAKNLRILIKVVDAATVAWAAFGAANLIVGKRIAMVVTAEQQAAINETIRTRSVGKLTKMIMKQAAAEKALAAATTQAVAGTNALSRAMGRLKVAILTNPWLALGAAILGVVFALTQFKKQANGAKEATRSLDQAIDDMHKANKDFGKWDALIARYENLTTNTERTATENETLEKTIKKLAGAFPDLADKINNENLSLEEQIELVKELNAENEKRLQDEKDKKIAEITAKEGQLDEAKRLRDEAQANKDEATALYNEAKAAYDRFKETSRGMGWFQRLITGFGAEGRAVLKRVYEDADDALNKADTAFNEANKSVADLEDGIKRLRQEVYGFTTDELEGWQEEIVKIQKRMAPTGAQVFSPTEIEGLTSPIKVYDALINKVQEYNAAIEKNQDILKNSTDASIRRRAYEQLTLFEKLKAVVQAIWAALIGGEMPVTKTTPRDTRLSQLKSDISELTNAYKKFKEIRKYKSESAALIDINELFPQLKGWTPTYQNLLDRLVEMRKDVAKKLAKSPKSKTLLDMQRALDTEISNLQFDDLKDKLEAQLKKISDEMKRSETARNFYKNILDMTGDEKMAMTLTMEVYGQTGKEFKERVQDEMFGALQSVKDLMSEDFFNEMIGNVTIFDMKEIRKQLDKLPITIQPIFKRLLAEEEKYNADWLTNLIKTYEKTKSYEERITDIRKREAKVREDIAKSEKLTPEQKATYTAASEKKEAKEIAKVEEERLKNNYAWIKSFEDLEGVSDRTLQNLIDLLDEYIKKYGKDLEPQQLKELTRAKESAQAQMLQRHSAEKLETALSDLAKAKEKLKKLEAEGKENTEEYAQALDDQQRAANDAAEAIAEMQSVLGQVTSKVKDLLSAFGADDYFSEQLDNIANVINGLGDATAGIIGIAANPADVSAWLKAGSGLADIVIGVVKSINASKLKKFNDELDAQDKILRRLERRYNKLSDALDSAFGSDYIYLYKEQLKELEAEYQAYLNKQEAAQKLAVEASREEDRKAAREQAQEFADAAEDAQKKMADAKKGLQEYYAGSSLTSAAEEFANSWLEAYREFGDTTEAIQQKMEEMINNLIVKSTLAGAAQAVLKPFFDAIEEAADSAEGMSPANIAKLTNMLTGKTEELNQTLTAWMQVLRGQGIDVRSMTGGASGIAREYATASEESILALAAGVNTQNFYMSSIKDNVQLIYEILSGKAVSSAAKAAAPATEEGEGMPSVQKMMYDHLGNIDNNIRDIKNMLQNVITTGSNNGYYVITKS